MMRYTGHKRRPRVRCWLAVIACVIILALPLCINARALGVIAL